MSAATHHLRVMLRLLGTTRGGLVAMLVLVNCVPMVAMSMFVAAEQATFEQREMRSRWSVSSKCDTAGNPSSSMASEGAKPTSAPVGPASTVLLVMAPHRAVVQRLTCSALMLSS